MVLDVERSETAHPFVGMIDDLLLLKLKEAVEAFHYQSGSIGEHAGLVIVAVCMQGVNLPVLPKVGVDSLLLSKEGFEIHEDGDRLAWDVPASHLHLELCLGVDIRCFLQPFLPFGKDAVVLNEERALLFAPAVRANEDDMVGHSVLKRLGAC